MPDGNDPAKIEKGGPETGPRMERGTETIHIDHLYYTDVLPLFST